MNDDDALASKENDSSSMACSRSDAGDGRPTMRLPPLTPTAEAEGNGLDPVFNEPLAAGSSTPSPSNCGDGDAETGAKFAAALEAAAALAEGADEEEGADELADAAAGAAAEGTAVGPSANRVVVDCARDGG